VVVVVVVVVVVAVAVIVIAVAISCGCCRRCGLMVLSPPDYANLQVGCFLGMTDVIDVI
jgi:hypothetical protein